MMYDRFTERARLVMVYAKDEAVRHGSSHAATEHFLLGLIGEQESIAAMVIRNLGCDPELLRAELEKLMPREASGLKTNDIMLSPSGKRAIEYAKQEAQNLSQNYIGTEHLLLGVLRENEGIAARVLQIHGIDIVKARYEVLRLLGGSSQVESNNKTEEETVDETVEAEVNLPGRLTAGAWLGVQRARFAAIQCGSRSIGTLHLTFGLIVEDSGVLAGILKNTECCLDDVREMILDLIQLKDDERYFRETPLSTSCRRVVQHAEQEAAAMSHRHIGIEHLFLGILCEKESAASKLLALKGLAIEKVREEISRLYDAGRAD